MIVDAPTNFSAALAALQQAGQLPADLSPDQIAALHAGLKKKSSERGQQLMDDIFGIYQKHLGANAPKLSVKKLLSDVTRRARKTVTLAKHDDNRAGIQKIYTAALQRVLAHAKKEALGNLSGRFANAIFANATTPSLADFPFNLSNFSKMFFAEMRDAGEAALQASGESRAEEFGLDPDQFVTAHGVAQKFLIDRENKLKDVPQEIYDTLKTSLEEGSKAGETERQLAARVADVMGDIEDGRAQTIARTETLSAYGTASQDAINQAGFTGKSWLTADDGKVRSSHEECEAQGAIPVDESFANGLDFPGDPTGDADEVINCRCVLQAEDLPAGEEGDA